MPHFDGSFNFVLGASYLDDDNEFTLGYMGELFGYFLLGRTEHDMDSTSFYFDGSYELTDALTLTGGVRNTKDEQDLTTFAFGATGNDSSSFSDTTYRVVLDYDVSDSLMVYGSFNTGFKSGGFIDPRQVQMRRLIPLSWARSMPAKVFLLRQPFLTMTGRIVPVLTQENADAEMTGFEFSSTFRPSENLSIWIAGTWLDGEYTTYNASTHVPASRLLPGLEVLLAPYQRTYLATDSLMPLSLA